MGAFTMIYLETNIRPGKDHESELLSQEGTARELDDYDEDVEESDEDNDEAFFENVSSRKGLITLDDSGLQIDFSKMSFNVTLQNHNHVLMLRLFFFFFLQVSTPTKNGVYIQVHSRQEQSIELINSLAAYKKSRHPGSLFPSVDVSATFYNILTHRTLTLGTLDWRIPGFGRRT
jgi:hypothetical protein